MKGRMRGRLFKVWSTEHRSAFSGQPANRASNEFHSVERRPWNRRFSRGTRGNRTPRARPCAKSFLLRGN